MFCLFLNQTLWRVRLIRRLKVTQWHTPSVWRFYHKYGNTLGEEKSHPTWNTEQRFLVLCSFHYPELKVLIQWFLKLKVETSYERERSSERTKEPKEWNYFVQWYTLSGYTVLYSRRRLVVGRSLIWGVRLLDVPNLGW